MRPSSTRKFNMIMRKKLTGKRLYMHLCLWEVKRYKMNLQDLFDLLVQTMMKQFQLHLLCIMNEWWISTQYLNGSGLCFSFPSIIHCLLQEYVESSKRTQTIWIMMCVWTHFFSFLVLKKKKKKKIAPGRQSIVQLIKANTLDTCWTQEKKKRETKRHELS